jgi:hypothetical protein
MQGKSRQSTTPTLPWRVDLPLRIPLSVCLPSVAAFLPPRLFTVFCNYFHTMSSLVDPLQGTAKILEILERILPKCIDYCKNMKLCPNERKIILDLKVVEQEIGCLDDEQKRLYPDRLAEIEKACKRYVHVLPQSSTRSRFLISPAESPLPRMHCLAWIYEAFGRNGVNNTGRSSIWRRKLLTRRSVWQL